MWRKRLAFAWCAAGTPSQAFARVRRRGAAATLHPQAGRTAGPPRPTAGRRAGPPQKSFFLFAILETTIAVRVTATYKAKPVTRFTVTVVNGVADKATAAKGKTVTITAAEPPAKKQFYKWTCNGLTFEDANVVQTTFVMPKKSVWVKANYTAAP